MCEDDKVKGNRCDNDWDYCSVNDQHTRYNYQCEGPCTFQKQKFVTMSYYWCKQGDSWEYCSPKAKPNLHFNDKIELSTTGEICRSKCGKHGKKHHNCLLFGREERSQGGLCSPDNKTTYYGERCMDDCDARGYKFYWCNTETSWDYCSPTFKVGMLGFESVTAAGGYLECQIILLGMRGCSIFQNLTSKPNVPYLNYLILILNYQLPLVTCTTKVV